MAEPNQIAAQLQSLQSNYPLKIIDLSTTLRPNTSATSASRISNVSDTSLPDSAAPTPATLEADLIHYKELFGKLRFSYVEQVTKEKFLRAITDNPPLYVEHGENVELEGVLGSKKRELKESKREVESLIEELERTGKDLAGRYESIQLRSSQLESLPSEIQNLETEIEQLRSQAAPAAENPTLALPLPETQNLLQQRENELASLNSQIATLEASLPRKTRELERLERELAPLEEKKQHTVTAAKEARKRREAGEAGMGDELEERGRWLTAVEKGLTGMLEVKS